MTRIGIVKLKNTDKVVLKVAFGDISLHPEQIKKTVFVSTIL